MIAHWYPHWYPLALPIRTRLVPLKEIPVFLCALVNG